MAPPPNREKIDKILRDHSSQGAIVWRRNGLSIVWLVSDLSRELNTQQETVVQAERLILKHEALSEERLEFWRD